MGLINRLHTFATMPGISPDIGSKIDQELNTLFNLVNGYIDNANISGNPDIESSKLSLGSANYLPLAGGTLTGVLNHTFDGIWRGMGPSGTGLVREYRYGNTVWGISYNTSILSDGNWAIRDISDICLRLELTKTSDGWGGLRVYLADSLGGAPTWNPVQHYEPMGGHSRYHNGTAWTNIGDITETNRSDSGIFHYNNLIIPSGVTWTLQQGKPLIIFARESVTISGTIDGNGMGASGGASVTGTYTTGNVGGSSIGGGTGGGGGGSDGGNGAQGGDSRYSGFTSLGGLGVTSTPGNGGNGNLSPLSKLMLVINNTSVAVGGSGGGSGGGYQSGWSGVGGNGGGYVYIAAPIINITGIIQCSGGIGGNGNRSGGGGGGGGIIHLRGKSIVNSGTKTVTGGQGGTSNTTGGNGGAGVIYIEEYK